MRIVWLSHRAHVGGAELSLAEGVKALARRGHDVHVIMPEEGQLRGMLGDAKAVHICHHNPWVASQRGITLAARWLMYDAIIATPRIASILRRVRAEALISNTITPIAGAVASRRTGTPHLWFIREFGREPLRFLAGERTTMRAMRALADGFIVNSHTLSRHFALWLPAERLSVAYAAVEVGMSQHTMIRPVLRERDPVRLVIVGRKTAAKGQLDAVEAVRLLRAIGVPVRLELVGDSDHPYEWELRAAVERAALHEQVRFVPFTSDRLRHLAQADIVLTCSRSEALGRVTVEAMKLGKPVIAAAAGANAELVRHGWNGLLYRAGAPSELARCVEVLLRDPQTARTMGARGREWAARHFNGASYGLAIERAMLAAVERKRRQRS